MPLSIFGTVIEIATVFVPDFELVNVSVFVILWLSMTLLYISLLIVFDIVSVVVSPPVVRSQRRRSSGSCRTCRERSSPLVSTTISPEIQENNMFDLNSILWLWVLNWNWKISINSRSQCGLCSRQSEEAWLRLHRGCSRPHPCKRTLHSLLDF